MSGGAEGPSVLRSAAAMVYLEHLDAELLEVADAHHLSDVLRLRPGEEVVAADGAGAWRRCAVQSVTRATRREAARIELVALGAPVREEPPGSPITVAFGLLKGERSEWAVQKLTELGIDRIAPLLTERSVVRLAPAERRRRGERLRAVAREAGAQSRRPRLPEVLDPLSFSEFTAGLGGAARLAEPGAEEDLAALDAADLDTVLVGPEGGWAPQELACGLGWVGLGDAVLRGETAALCAATLLAARRRAGARR